MSDIDREKLERIRKATYSNVFIPGIKNKKTRTSIVTGMVNEIKNIVGEKNDN